MSNDADILKAIGALFDEMSPSGKASCETIITTQIFANEHVLIRKAIELVWEHTPNRRYGHALGEALGVTINSVSLEKDKVSVYQDLIHALLEWGQMTVGDL